MLTMHVTSVETGTFSELLSRAPHQALIRLFPLENVQSWDKTEWGTFIECDMLRDGKEYGALHVLQDDGTLRPLPIEPFCYGDDWFVNREGIWVFRMPKKEEIVCFSHDATTSKTVRLPSPAYSIWQNGPYLFAELEEGDTILLIEKGQVSAVQKDDWRVKTDWSDEHGGVLITSENELVHIDALGTHTSCGKYECDEGSATLGDNGRIYFTNYDGLFALDAQREVHRIQLPNGVELASLRGTPHGVLIHNHDEGGICLVREGREPELLVHLHADALWEGCPEGVTFSHQNALWLCVIK